MTEFFCVSSSCESRSVGVEQSEPKDLSEQSGAGRGGAEKRENVTKRFEDEDEKWGEKKHKGKRKCHKTRLQRRRHDRLMGIKDAGIKTIVVFLKKALML